MKKTSQKGIIVALSLLALSICGQAMAAEPRPLEPLRELQEWVLDKIEALLGSDATTTSWGPHPTPEGSTREVDAVSGPFPEPNGISAQGESSSEDEEDENSWGPYSEPNGSPEGSWGPITDPNG